jgi:hypothetical protein|tara:strand:- start:345 stop:584 length:240 start_codon:yes stop_codon:yes gene_type:complete
VVIDILKTINKITLDVIENDVKPIIEIWFGNPSQDIVGEETPEYDYRDESEILEQPLNDVGYVDSSRKPPYVQKENGFI